MMCRREPREALFGTGKEAHSSSLCHVGATDTGGGFQFQGHLLHHLAAGEQAESTPLADSKDFRDMRLCGIEETVIARIWNIFWHIQECLLWIVKERGDDDLFGCGDSERLPHVREPFLNCECRRCKDRRIVRLKHAGR